MKAVVYSEYGPPDRLRLAKLPVPTPAPDEVLVRLYATSVNSWDWDKLTGTPLVARIDSLKKPAHPVLGCDIAGVVEAIGADVTRFAIGDAVFGDLSGGNWGGFAEYTTARESALTTKPDEMSFPEAAALPQAGLLALQGLRCKGAIKPGDKVLINGAGGGVGSFGIQLAKLWGAEVTGVDSADKLSFMREAGADHTIDYGATDFAASGQRYDLILDVTARRPLRHYRRALTPNGRLIVVGGKTGTLIKVALASLFPRNQIMALLIHRPDIADLDEIKALVAAGTLRCMIGKTYPLNRTAEAIREIGEGRGKGKVVVTMREDRP